MLLIAALLAIPAVFGFAFGKLPGNQGMPAQAGILLFSAGMSWAVLFYEGQQGDAIEAAACCCGAYLLFIAMIAVCIGYGLSGRLK